MRWPDPDELLRFRPFAERIVPRSCGSAAVPIPSL